MCKYASCALGSAALVRYYQEKFSGSSTDTSLSATIEKDSSDVFAPAAGSSLL